MQSKLKKTTNIQLDRAGTGRYSAATGNFAKPILEYSTCATPPPPQQHTHRLSLVALAVVGLGMLAVTSCYDLGSGPNEGLLNNSPPVPKLAGAMVCAQGTFIAFDAEWSCNQWVSFYGGTPFLQGSIVGPVNAWNAALQATSAPGVPTFTTTQTPSEATAIITGVNGGTEFCGVWDQDTRVMSIVTTSNQACADNPNKASLSDVLVHELSHVWGWTGSAAHTLGVAGVSDHCAIVIPATGLNTDICAHMVEGGLAGYGLRSFNPLTFWSTPFVTGYSAPSAFSPISLVVGQLDTLSLGVFSKELGGTVTGSWSVSSSDTNVATVNSSGIITAVDSGTAVVTVSPNNISGYLLTSEFLQSSRTVTVTVARQPPAYLVVQNVTINTSLPITTADGYTWTAVLGSGDPSGITFRWVIEYSDNTPPDSIFVPAREPGDTISPWVAPSPGDTVYVGSAQSWGGWVHEGSYTIWIKVWPVRDSIVGMPAAREFSVCTDGEGGGGSNYLRAVPDDDMKNGGGGTDAVEGC